MGVEDQKQNSHLRVPGCHCHAFYTQRAHLLDAARAECGCALQVKPLHKELPKQLLQDILLGLRNPCSLELRRLQADIESALTQLMPTDNNTR